MPELTSTDVLVGRIALSQGKITRPQLDQAIALCKSGQAHSLAHAIVHARLVTADEMRSIVQAARTQETSLGAANSVTGSTIQRALPSNGPASPYPPPQRGAPAAVPAPMATVPVGEFSGMQSVRVRGGAFGAPQAAPLPSVGSSAHDSLRAQYEDYVLGRLLVARGVIPDAQLQEIVRRQKLDQTASGRSDPLMRMLIRAGLVSPAVIDQYSDEVRRKVFACARCGDCNYVEPGPEPQRLACRRCQGPVDVASLDGRMPALRPEQATQMDAGSGSGGGEVTMAMPGPGAAPGFGSAPGFGASPGFGSAPASGFGGGFPGGGGGFGDGGGFGAAPGGGGFGAAPGGFGSNPTEGGGASGEGQPEAVGEWVIEREIGRGGMGVIYLARHRTRGEKAALKLMLNAPQASEKKQRRFTREMDAARKLDHPGIVRLLDAGEHEGFPYFAMEFVDGKPLDKLLKEELDLELGMEVLEKLCRAVHHAHEHGIVHRDLKPANVLVDDNMNPKLTDFGLAKSEDHKSVLTKTGAVVGTPYYLSPEQARGNSKDVDRRADIYALGVIMYELITGRLPFVGQTTVELYNRILNDDPPPPTKVKPQLTKEIETVCLHALEKNPRERYQSANQLGDDIKALLEAKPIMARPPGPVKRFMRRMKKKGLGTILAVVVVAGLGLIAGSTAWYVWREKQKTTEEQAFAERKLVIEQLEGSAKVVSASILKGERAIALGRDRDALAAANEAVVAGEAAEAAFALAKLDANKQWLDKLKADRGQEGKRIHSTALVLRARTFVSADEAQAVEKGQRDLDAAAALDPDSQEVICAQAEVSLLALKIGDAVEKLRSPPVAGYVPARILEARIHRLIRDEPQEALRSIGTALDLLGADDKAVARNAIRDDWTRSKARVLVEKALATAAFDAEEAPTRALPHADEALKLAPDLWEGHAARARILVGLGRRYEAREEVRKVAELAKDQLPALLEQGEIYLLLRRVDEAREVAEATINSFPSALDAYVLRARVHEANLDDKSARQDADYAAQHAQGVKKYWAPGSKGRRILAKIVLMGGETTEIKNKGLEHANATKDLDPESAATKLTMARVFLHPAFGSATTNLDTVEKGLKEAQKRWGTNPDLKRAAAMLAEARNPGQALVKAKELAQKSLKSDPGSAWSHAFLARVERSAGQPNDPDPETAVKESLRALELERDTRRDEGYYYAAGLRRVLKGGSKDDAQAALRRAIYADPLHAQALTVFGDVLISSQAGRAYELYVQAVQASPLYAQGHLGLAAYAAGRHQEAKVQKQIEEEIDRVEKLRGGPTSDTLATRALLYAAALSERATNDPGYQARLLEVASIYSQACNLDPSNLQLAQARAQYITGLATRPGVPAEVRAFGEKTKKDHDRDANSLSKRGDEALEMSRDALQALKTQRSADALTIAKNATRRAPWVVDAWLALSDARCATNDGAGALSALGRAAGADRDLKGLAALASAVRELRAQKKSVDAGNLDDVASRDADAALFTSDMKVLIRALVASTSALIANEPKGARAKEALELTRDLVTRRPDQIAFVFARGLAALAAAEHDDAMRELGFAAAAADEKGELHYLHALACARASAAASDWRKAAYADDALEALERAIAASPDLAAKAKDDADLKTIAARLAK